MIYAKIVADSISEQGIRITTMELCYHRFIHSEFMTHRMFSRNASSSRAIPVEKMINQVKENPATPIHWGKNQPGMQAREEFDEDDILGFQSDWMETAKKVGEVAKYLSVLGLHKQVVNRLLEPFQFIKVIVTATEWDNFFNLRLHPDAQPEIQELARCMKEAMEASSPMLLKRGEWHLPYITEDEGISLLLDAEYTKFNIEKAIKCSVARCARVSYNNHDNSSPDINKDIALADKLLEAGHMSPFEHVATPMEISNAYETLSGRAWEKGITHIDRHGTFWSSNFRGWIQYRNLL